MVQVAEGTVQLPDAPVQVRGAMVQVRRAIVQVSVAADLHLGDSTGPISGASCILRGAMVQLAFIFASSRPPPVARRPSPEQPPPCPPDP